MGVIVSRTPSFKGIGKSLGSPVATTCCPPRRKPPNGMPDPRSEEGGGDAGGNGGALVVPKLVYPEEEESENSLESTEATMQTRSTDTSNNASPFWEKRDCVRSVSDPGNKRLISATQSSATSTSECEDEDATREKTTSKDNNETLALPNSRRRITSPTLTLVATPSVEQTLRDEISEEELREKRRSDGWLQIEESNRWRRQTIPKVASTGCLSKLAASSDHVPLHPAISNTNLASMKLKPMPVVADNGNIFNHPAIVLPAPMKQKLEMRKSWGGPPPSKSDHHHHHRAKTERRPKKKTTKKFDRQTSLIGVEGSHNTSVSKDVTTDDVSDNNDNSGGLYKRHSFGTKEEHRTDSIDMIISGSKKKSDGAMDSKRVSTSSPVADDDDVFLATVKLSEDDSKKHHGRSKSVNIQKTEDP